MSHENPGTIPAGPPGASGSIIPSTAQPANAVTPATFRLLAMALVAAVVAGLASWSAGEAAVQRYFPDMRVTEKQFNSMEKVTYERLRRLHESITYRAMVSYGVLGAALGLALGLVGGLARRSAAAGLLAAVLGVVLGGAAGAGATKGLLPIYFHALRTSEDHLASDITTPLLIHGGIWTAAGLAAGLALGLGLGGLGRAVQAGIGGALGAMAGTFLYEFAGPFAFPDGETAEPLASERFARLLAHLSVAVLVALGAAWCARYLTPKRATKTPQAD
jgi:hypothetical protein